MTIRYAFERWLLLMFPGRFQSLEPRRNPDLLERPEARVWGFWEALSPWYTLRCGNRYSSPYLAYANCCLTGEPTSITEFVRYMAWESADYSAEEYEDAALEP